MAEALRLEHVSLSYGARQALDDVSFSVAPGRFCALLGPNGAGKSTLFGLMTRLLVTRSGRIEIAGHDVARAPRKALARIGVVFQQPTLDLDLTVARNMRYFAALHGLSGRAAAIRIDAALDRLAMRERAGEKARALNGGHRRRMEIARALVHEPDLLLLDEPTVGLDAMSRKAITAHVHDLAEDGLSVLWATHLVDEIGPGDDVVVLHRGRVLRQALASDIAGPAGLAEAFLEMTAEGGGA
ncbi:ABC transporter ATP-binding protein [Rhodovulum sulfidophilum]|uniref:ABC-2 type transport system ATP-binding protein n=1 Tax=Rhodovulum visakhapatnamense TaxID=364297 RepID=A0A4V3GU90_9RHOB|nr:ABC transporter ATP-binding protein [Rhodovulum visakhapatnamense]MBL3569650.1 ATP-binding cassette domain-containing protein [Rhodovulum visakhapatnamense]MBL3577882.1 ATP-binding cassette domain-containing protein [Rhodovulum visakhapatnamense]OLS43687.1 ABC transporter ATP-binding protein [Rhodovulum sulfidophilum]TDX29738.1 ABC-2 type transport system ATP-binding protein [Rhodovulum visakhapatnamense]